MARSRRRTTSSPPRSRSAPRTIERAQTGVRVEKRILKVLKALAEYHEISLGELLEGIALHAFEGVSPFGARTLDKIASLAKVYDLDLCAADSHALVERRQREGG